MDEKWVASCLADTKSTLTEQISGSEDGGITGLDSAAQEICLSILEGAQLGIFLSLFGATLAIVATILSLIPLEKLNLIRFQDFEKTRRFGSLVLGISGLVVSVVGAAINGGWFTWLSVGMAFLTTIVFTLLILVVPSLVKPSKKEDSTSPDKTIESEIL